VNVGFKCFFSKLTVSTWSHGCTTLTRELSLDAVCNVKVKSEICLSVKLTVTLTVRVVDSI